MTSYDELKKAAEAATPGPWEYYEHDNFIASKSVLSRISDYPVTRSTDVGVEQRIKNSTFIALANPATILALLAEREKLLKVAALAKKVPISYHANWPIYAELSAALKELDK